MKVRIYRNLHNKCFSIQKLPDRRVFAHRTAVLLKNARFHVSDAGRKRVRREKRKNVHAFVIGDWIADKEPRRAADGQAVYNPYRYKFFVDSKTGDWLKGEFEAVCAEMTPMGCVIRYWRAT